MVPIRLTLEGLYSYQKKQVIDFERLTQAQLFGIFGATGSGKSSILEAITLALYGECERLTRNTKNYNLMNLRSGRLTVDLEFSLSGKEENRYRFVVSGKRNAKNFDKIQYQRQAYHKQAQTWEPVDLDTAESLIGLGYNHFKRTIIIPQGKFREFLDMKDTARSEMLNQIFGLHKYRLSPQVKQLIRGNEKSIAEKNALLQQYIEVSEEHIAQLQEEIEAQTSELQVKQQTLEQRRTLNKEYEQLQVQHAQLKVLEQQLAQLTAQKSSYEERDKLYQQYVSCLSQFREPLNKQTEVGSQIQQLAQTLTTEQETIESLKQGLTKARNTYQEVQTAFAERHLLAEKAEEWRKIIQLKKEEELYSHLDSRRKKGKTKVDELKREIEALKSQIQTTEGEITQLKERQPATQEILAVQEWGQQKKHLLEQAQQIESEKQQLEEEIDNSVKKKRDLLDNTFLDPRQYELPSSQIAALFQQEMSRLAQRIQEVEQKREELLLRHKLETLSDTLKEGEPCPLCGSTHHPLPLNASSLDKELQHLEKFRKKLLGDMRKLESGAPLLMELAEQAIGIKQRSKEVQKRMAVVTQGLEKHESTRPILKEDWEEGEIDEIASLFQTIDTEINEKEIHLQALKARIAQEEEKLETWQKSLNEIQQQFSEKQGEFTSRKESLKQLIYTDQRQLSDTFLQEQAVKADKEYQEIGELQKSLTEKVEQQQNQLKLLEGKWESQQAAYKDLTQKAAKLTQEIHEVLAESDFETIDQVRQILALNMNIDAEREAIQDYHKELVQVETQTRELRQHIGNHSYSPAEHHAFQSELEVLETAYTQFSQALGIKKHLLKQQIEDLQKKQGLEKEMEALTTREENLKLMQNLFRGDAFVRYVSSAYLENLCSAANERFMRLTRNALSLEIDEHNQFHIRDWLNDGKRRSARTLSGGQSFQAALCLALALSDQVQQQVQAEQRFFFLDEGFGALDKESLRLIFFTLQSLQKENRIVGIISHVEELQQEIDTYLQVQNDPELGSQVVGSWEG
ncbi:MAG: SMC family ATPase [Bacteroidota bacterium]